MNLDLESEESVSHHLPLIICLLSSLAQKVESSQALPISLVLLDLQLLTVMETNLTHKK